MNLRRLSVFSLGFALLVGCGSGVSAGPTAQTNQDPAPNPNTPLPSPSAPRGNAEDPPVNDQRPPSSTDQGSSSVGTGAFGGETNQGHGGRRGGGDGGSGNGNGGSGNTAGTGDVGACSPTVNNCGNCDLANDCMNTCNCYNQLGGTTQTDCATVCAAFSN